MFSDYFVAANIQNLSLFVGTSNLVFITKEIAEMYIVILFKYLQIHFNLFLWTIIVRTLIIFITTIL